MRCHPRKSQKDRTHALQQADLWDFYSSPPLSPVYQRDLSCSPLSLMSLFGPLKYLMFWSRTLQTKHLLISKDNFWSQWGNCWKQTCKCPRASQKLANMNNDSYLCSCHLSSAESGTSDGREPHTTVPFSAGIGDECSAPYLDVVLCLRQVFHWMQYNGIELHPVTCELFKREIRYIGHMVRGKWTQIDPKDLEAVSSLKNKEPCSNI